MSLNPVIHRFLPSTIHSRRRLVVPVMLILILSACGGLAGEPKIVATLPQAPTQIPAPTRVPAPDVGYPVQSPDMALGAQIYAARCAGCHGVNGNGSGQLASPPPDFSDPATARLQTPSEWFSTITNGRMDKLMPPWQQKLSEDERWAVALYTYTMAYSPEQLLRGLAIWEANCAACHGATGIGDGPNAPQSIVNLTAQNDMVVRSDGDLFAIVTEGRGQMPAFGDRLTEDQRQDVAAYARTLSLDNAGSIAQAAQTTPVGSPAAPTAVPSAQVSGTVGGIVTNGTAGGTVPPDLTLILHVLDVIGNDQTFDTTVRPDGTYLFENVPIFAPADYVVLARYQERSFGREQIIDDTSSTHLDLPISIYDLTDDPSVIHFTQVLMQIVAVSGGLEITQVMTVENTSDRAYTTGELVGEDRYISLKINVPPGAQLVDLDSTTRYVVSDDLTTVMDTRIVSPGSHDPVHMVYFLPYSSGATLQQTLNYALDGPVLLYLEQGQLSVVSDQLPAVGPQQLGDAVYQGYGADLALAAGASLSFDVRGDLPDTSSPFGDQSTVISTNTLIAIAIIVFGALAIIVGGIIYLRRRRQPVAAVASGGDGQLMDGLIRQIAELDEAYHAGEIDEPTYQRRRRKLKARLADLMEKE